MSEKYLGIVRIPVSHKSLAFPSPKQSPTHSPLHKKLKINPKTKQGSRRLQHLCIAPEFPRILLETPWEYVIEQMQPINLVKSLSNVSIFAGNRFGTATYEHDLSRRKTNYPLQKKTLGIRISVPTSMYTFSYR